MHRRSTYAARVAVSGLALLAVVIFSGGGLSTPNAARVAFAATAPAGMTPEMLAAARKEGEVNYYHVNEMAHGNKLKAAFEKKYGIKVNILRLSSSILFNRVVQEFDTGVNAADVVETAVIDHFINMKSKGMLQLFIPASINLNLYGSPGYYDAEHYWHGTRIAPSTINYNKDLLKGDMVPKTWKDLTDPKYKDKMVQGHPKASGASALIVYSLVKLYGWQYFDALKKNNIMTQQSCVQPNLLASGERLLIPCDYSTTPAGQSQGLPFASVFPQDGVFLILAPAAVLAKAPHPNAGKLLLNWLTSLEGQNLYTEGGFLSPLDSPEVKYPPSFPNPKSLKLIQSNPEEVRKWLPGGLEKFAELFGG